MKIIESKNNRNKWFRGMVIVIPVVIGVAVFLGSVWSGFYRVWQLNNEYKQTVAKLVNDKNGLTVASMDLDSRVKELEADDQKLINDKLKQDIKITKETFLQTVKIYELMTDGNVGSKKTEIDKEFASVMRDLADLKHTSASAKLLTLKKKIDEAVLANSVLKGIDISTVTANNAPPGSGYSRQKVKVGSSEFVVDIIAGDLGNTKVIVDTAADNDCGNDCPVLPLGTYVSRSGGFAGINGSYFCPSSYPTCAGKTNSYDLLVMNKNKKWFNSDNNVYSTNPAVVFGGSYVKFVSRALELGRDTNMDSVISNFPLLIIGKSVQFGGNDDAKMSGTGNRAFVASKGNVVYIGVVRGVSVAGAAQVLNAMGMENAINLDSGGSTALWANGGYKYGPGRNIPNAIVMVRK